MQTHLVSCTTPRRSWIKWQARFHCISSICTQHSSSMQCVVPVCRKRASSQSLLCLQGMRRRVSPTSHHLLFIKRQFLPLLKAKADSALYRSPATRSRKDLCRSHGVLVVITAVAPLVVVVVGQPFSARMHAMHLTRSRRYICSPESSYAMSCDEGIYYFASGERLRRRQRSGSDGWRGVSGAVLCMRRSFSNSSSSSRSRR